MAKRKLNKSKSVLFKSFTWLILLLVVGYLGYSVWYANKVNPEQGIITCAPAKSQSLIFKPVLAHEGEDAQALEDATPEELIKDEINHPENAGKCFYSAHIHATIDLTYCGANLEMPKDKGILSGPHTHKEPNLLHSAHAALDVDPGSREVIDKTPLTVGGFLDAMDIDLASACPGASHSEAEVTVGGEDKSLDYIWKDGDTIKVIYR